MNFVLRSNAMIYKRKVARIHFVHSWTWSARKLIKLWFNSSQAFPMLPSNWTTETCWLLKNRLINNDLFESCQIKCPLGNFSSLLQHKIWILSETFFNSLSSQERHGEDKNSFWKLLSIACILIKSIRSFAVQCALRALDDVYISSCCQYYIAHCRCRHGKRYWNILWRFNKFYEADDDDNIFG